MQLGFKLGWSMNDRNWYRNTKWNDEIEAQFLERLSRSRSSRDQQLVIQASTLSKTEPEASLWLVELFFETRTDAFQDVLAYMAAAEAYQSLGQLEAAISQYKSVLKREEECPKHLTNVYLELPYLIATRSLEEHFGFAVRLLAKGPREVSFPVDHFMFHAAKALIAAQQRKDEIAYTHARTAIGVAGIRKSGFRYHQSIGLVGRQHDATFKKLLRIAG